MKNSPIALKYVFFGTGELGVPSLEALIDLGAKPALIVTAPDRPAGRGLRLKHSPIKEIALHAGIHIYQPENVNQPEVVDYIRRHGADLGVIIAYGQKIGPVLINIFPRGIINLHASLLPKYRGAAPINWAIINGERETGVTVMQINEQIDAGMILAMRKVPIGPLERADELHEKLAKAGPEVLIETIVNIQKNTLTPQPQDPCEVTKAPKMSKAMSEIDWSLPAQKIAGLVRGLWPWPTATSVYRSKSGKTVSVAMARAMAMAMAVGEAETHLHDKTPGLILNDFSIATGLGRLTPLEIKPAGSKLMSWQDFINGRHVQPGDQFVSVEMSADEKTKLAQ